MHLHILGICGTFMGGLALLARALGHQVSGSDANVYPPMSTQLEAAGIRLDEGYREDHLRPTPDCVVIGNALSRGNPAVEFVLDSNLPYTSGPQWLSDHVLQERWVLAVAGTHGKTTTAGMLAWILEEAGLHPGFLIGGIPRNFDVSARLGESPFFVVEADEYDTAFFDKRSKFVHYRPRTLVLNNLEFDHADIFEDLGMIQRQFHHLMRTVPGNGLLITPANDRAIQEVLDMGCWTPVETVSTDPQEEAYWLGRPLAADCREAEVCLGGVPAGTLHWNLSGRHNLHNALAAVAAARHAGVTPSTAIDALGRFANVKRRLELRGEIGGISVFDDFAHHPTAIEATLAGLRAQDTARRILAVLEPRSNSMRMGTHNDLLAASLRDADKIIVFRDTDLAWNPATELAELGSRLSVHDSVQAIVEHLANEARQGDRILVMSNGGFQNLHRRLLERLEITYRHRDTC
jgi:UDP-N-acetylmuramate: L-alanyl-gamma-D-glutamyl-meso-diaminopimelate ligase